MQTALEYKNQKLAIVRETCVNNKWREEFLTPLTMNVWSCGDDLTTHEAGVWAHCIVGFWHVIDN